MEKFSDQSLSILDRAKNLFGKQVDAIVRQEQKVVELLRNVKEKLSKLGNNPKVKKLIEPLSVFIRMIKAHFKGQHRIAYSTLFLIILALVYFLSPIDLIPDFLGFFGYADDLSVVMAVFAKIKDEVDSFLDWERTQV
ncbi:YkvA family protein [Algoriphagus confluentis]|uniref:YkvA family protein n=1 Tax=Algoriphagus confluentis TaxID=1697556 RepID=A0ABQ6PUZ1_9BACT|nr:YkvA family protein [Algoriphagus confluentis]